MSHERALVDVVHPTLCDETAKDGAPERFGRVRESGSRLARMPTSQNRDMGHPPLV